MIALAITVHNVIPVMAGKLNSVVRSAAGSLVIQIATTAIRGIFKKGGNLMRPIDAEALIRKRRNFGKPYALDAANENVDDQLVDLKHVLNAPTLDYAPVRHGEWVTVYPFKDNPQTTLECSECYTCQPIYEHDEWTFCPFCGAKMDAKE